MVLGTASLLTGLCLPTPSRAQPVDAGYDLLTAVPGGATFDGINWQGVPLNTYNFGGSIGVQNVGNTDTIIQRLAAATVPGTVSVQMDALQLESAVPAFGGNYAYITLDPNYTSVGTLTIESLPSAGSPGTFNDYFNVYFDVRYGSLSAPIEETDGVALTGAGFWSNDAPPGALTIPGVNYDLNGVDTSADFWLSSPSGGPEYQSISDFEVTPAISFEYTTSVPDATTTLALLLMPLGIFALGAARGKVARRA
jgi:hypothetical protein